MGRRIVDMVEVSSVVVEFVEFIVDIVDGFFFVVEGKGLNIV